MRQPFLFGMSLRSVPRRGAVTASAVAALAVLAPLSASAQIIGGLGQRSAGPPSPAPVFNQAPNFMPSPGSTSRPPQAYPQPNPPSGYVNRNAPVYPSTPPNRVFQPGPSGGGPQIFGSTQTLPGQPQFSGRGMYQTLPPGITSRTWSGMGSRGDSEQGQRQYSNQLLHPVTPRQPSAQPGVSGIYGSSSIYNNQSNRSVRVTTPTGQRTLHPNDYGNNYLYAPVAVFGGPSLLGGYYYGNYSNTYYADGPCYPSIYSSYPGFPEYIVNPGVIVLSEPYYPAYTTPYQPFYAPVYQVTYNQNNYYVTNEDRAQQIQDGGETAARALKNAYPENSFQAAFAEIQKAWKTGDIGLLRKHTRDTDTTLGVYFKGKYSYSIASGDFVKITRDAFDRLSTVSFEFTRLRKAKNGDVTAYGKHVYQTAGSSDASGDGASRDNTVPFSADGPQAGQTAQPYGRADDPAAGADKTIYISYTLRKHDDQWFIIGIDSSPTELVR